LPESLQIHAAPYPMQVWHQIRRVNVNILTTALRARTAKRPRLLFIGSPWRNRGGSIGSPRTHPSRLHKFRTRQDLILVSSLPYPLCSNMSARRPYSTNETNGKPSLANGIEESPTRRPQEAHHDAAELNHHHHDTYNHDSTSHSHSHSIFGHSHSNGVEAHTHGTEQIIAALEGKGLSIMIGFPYPLLKYNSIQLQGIEVARSRLLGWSVI
jgi:hypothetical protein